MIFLGVLILGWKQGALAGGIGAALADILGGYMHWILPTFFIQFMMAMVMGLIVERVFPKVKFGWIWGSVCGGVVQIFGYTFVKIVYYGFATAMTMTPTLIVQTISGIVLTAVFVVVLGTSGALEKVKAM